MAVCLASPCGLLSDEEEGGAAVFESTAADVGGLLGTRFRGVTMPEVSLISPSLEPQTPQRETKSGADRRGSTEEDAGSEKVKVYLRIRPLTEVEKERGEQQGCVFMQDKETLMLKAPKNSYNMKSAERGVAPNVHRFTFSQICGPETSQQEFYEHTMKDMVRDVLRGENRLLYTYGVTNSGKTYTVQGMGREAGLLPRALVSVFRKLQGRLYSAVDLKPVLCQEVRWLNSSEVRMEEIRRDLLLKEESSSSQNSRPQGSVSVSCDSGIGGLSATSYTANQMEDSDSVCLEADGLYHSGGEGLEDGVRFSVWVSFFEIYNEFLYDLLEAPPSLQPRKRATLRLCDDRHGNPYVKDLTWVQVHSAEEAWKILKIGRRNQSFACTHLNHNSSRSHSIFSMRILHIHPENDCGKGTRISELSVCDLAGSERCKEQRSGERMKEANNINTSLHTLGRCITALRNNQSSRSRPPQVVPFRDSKLTRVLQGFFSGRGRSCMVVNINPCASTYDETLQALKFSAIATQLVHGPSTKTRVAYIRSLLRENQQKPNESTLIEEEEEDSDEEEGDITMFDSEALLRAIDVLKGEVQRQRQQQEELEASVREQVCSEMMEIITRMETDFSETLDTQRALVEERYENKIENLQKSLKRYYSQELEERDEQIARLTAELKERRGSVDAPPVTPAPEAPPNPEGLRRSRRLASSSFSCSSSSSSSSSSTLSLLQTGELDKLRVELEQCRAELQEKTQELRRYQGLLSLPAPTGTLTAAVDRKLEEGQRGLRQLRADLQRVGAGLQAAERACCRNTSGERLRQALGTADDTLAKQDQALVELQNSLLLVKMDLRKKTDSLAQLQPLRPLTAPPAPGSCRKRGCEGAGPNAENLHPEKRPFFRSLFPARTPSRKGPPVHTPSSPNTPYARALRPRQQTPLTSPSPLRRRVNY